MIFLHLSLAIPLESIQKMIFKDSKKMKSPISTLSHGFLHETFQIVRYDIIDI